MYHAHLAFSKCNGDQKGYHRITNGILSPRIHRSIYLSPFMAFFYYSKNARDNLALSYIRVYGADSFLFLRRTRQLCKVSSLSLEGGIIKY